MKYGISSKLMKHTFGNRNSTYAPTLQTDSPIGKTKAVNCSKREFHTGNIKRYIDTFKKNT